MYICTHIHQHTHMTTTTCTCTHTCQYQTHDTCKKEFIECKGVINIHIIVYVSVYIATALQRFILIKHWFPYRPLIKLHSVLIYLHTMEWLSIVGWPWMIQISPWISHTLCTNVWGMSVWECYNCNIFMALILEDHLSN